jgi:hypothetical protein
MDRTISSSIKEIQPMSNSSRIEAATRQHIGATLTSEQIVDCVKASLPDWKGGVYPSDAAYVRTPEGLMPRGKVAYGDGVLEYLGANAFKVLKTEEIVRRPTTRKPAAVVAATPVAAVEAAKPEKKVGKKGKKASGTAGQIPVAPKQKASHARI